MPRRWFVLAGAVVAVGLLFWGIQFYRHRYVRKNGDVVRLLPPGDLNLVYADLGQLRQAQLVGLLKNIAVAPDQEYADFIRDTGFDYTRDLDAIVVGSDTSQTFLIGRGRFDWTKLQMFARSHNGTCAGDACRVPATTPGKWVNLITVQPDVLAVAISANQAAADELRPPGRRVQEEIPNAPFWAKVSHATLANPATLPLAARIFAIDLQSAANVTIAAMPDKVELRASFANGAAADTARRQLEIQTRLLTVALQQNGERADGGSLGGLMASGRFQVAGSEVNGSWAIRAELLRNLEQN